MKLYKDKDTYMYNKSLYDKQRKREARIKRIISALMACEIFCTVMAGITTTKYAFDKNNPFDGQSIASSDFSANYKAIRARSFIEDESFKETIENIKNSNMDEKKAYLLYYALLSNESLEVEEKQSLTNMIKYFCDNSYIDYEYIYNQLIQVKIIERNASFPGTNISSTFEYTMDSDGIVRGGKIRLGNEEDIYHEMACHGISRNHHVSWIEEGYASIIDAEYNNDNTSNIKGRIDSYPVETNVIRFLCEVMDKKEGRDCFFKIAAGKLDDKENVLDLLSSYLAKSGISRKLCDELYTTMDNFSEYRGKQLTEDEDEEVCKILESIVGILAKMYNDTFTDMRDKDYLCSKFLGNILSRNYTYLSTYKIYYFNKEQINNYPEPVTIVYYYPESLAEEILKKREKPTYQVTRFDFDKTNSLYIEVYEKELSLCNESNILKIKSYYLDNGIYEYVYDYENSVWRYNNVYIHFFEMEHYIDYYNGDIGPKK